MSRRVGSKHKLLALIFGWPLAVLVGWAVARITHVDWLAAVFPVAWLGLLFTQLRRYTNLSR
ncbi:MAG TPA: hypothetical protein VF595_18410 [Tepidisphaeraceae bacterium]|jgi:hypothetical protein